MSEQPDAAARARLILGVQPDDAAPAVDEAIKRAQAVGFKTAHGIARVAKDMLDHPRSST